MKTLLFQGDSITDCGRITSGGAGYPKDLWGPGYAGMIATQLMGDQPGKWQIINRGISGNTQPVRLPSSLKQTTPSCHPQ